MSFLVGAVVAGVAIFAGCSRDSGTPSDVSGDGLDASFDAVNDASVQDDHFGTDAGDSGEGILDAVEPYGDVADFPEETGDAASADDSADDPGDTASAAPMEIFGIDPVSGDGADGTTVTITGTGLSGVTEVWFGRVRSPSVFVISDTLVNCVAPPSRAGAVLVRAVDAAGREAVSPVKFLYTSDLAVFSVEPSEGPASGGTPVTIYGAGFYSSPDIYIGGRPAVSVTVADDGIILAVTPPGEPGPAAIRAVSGSGDVTVDDAFVYFADEVGPTMPEVEVTGVMPGTGPADGGTKVTVTGNGFFDGLGVRIGALPCAHVRFISEHLIEVETPPGTPGAADVTVFYRYASVTLRNGFFYRGRDGATSGIFGVEPPRASWSGGSLVSIRGFGLGKVDTVWFGAYAGDIVEHVSDFELLVSTPRAEEAGQVFVMTLGDGAAMLVDGFRFYDPYINGGGVRGGPISRNLNVTVYNGSTGARIEDAYVIVGSDLHTPLQGRTDDRGQITFSAKDLAGPVDVSATYETYTAFTYAGITGQDATLYIYSAPSPETPTEGGPGEPSQPCVVSGRVTDYGKYFIKPLWLDGTVWVECFTSTSSMYSSMPGVPETNRPDPDGFFSIPARSGEFAVVCRLMALENGAQSAYPLSMGIRRHVMCEDGVTPEVQVSLDMPTESSVRFGIRDVPAHPLGVWEPRFTGGWHLGTDGYLPLPVRGLFDGGTVQFDHMPDVHQGDETTGLAGLGYDLYITISSKDVTGLPYSVVQATGVEPVVDGALYQGVPPALALSPIGLSRSFTAFDGLADGTAMALDDSGRTWIYDGHALQAGAVVLNYRASGFVGASSGDFTAVGTRGRIFDVSGGVVNIIQTPFIADFLAIDGEVGGPQSIVTQSALLNRENGVISVESIPSGSVLKAVRRFEDGQIFAVGPDGIIVTGVSGTDLAAVRPVAEDLLAVEGDSPGRVWIAGENGRVISIRDGDVTVFKTPGSETLRGIVVIDECNVLFYGDLGAIYQFDCFGFTRISDSDSVPYAISGGVVVDRNSGAVALISSPVTDLSSFAGFPTMQVPADNSLWNRRDIVWTSGEPWGATHCQGLIAGALGSAFWQFTTGGAVSSISLPDFSQVIGYSPISGTLLKINLTCSRTPRFDIGNFDYRSLGSGNRETWAVDLSSFY